MACGPLSAHGDRASWGTPCPGGAHRAAPRAPACARPGLQTQTAECLVVGEVATSRMVVALNKVSARVFEQRAVGSG